MSQHLFPKFCIVIIFLSSSFPVAILEANEMVDYTFELPDTTIDNGWKWLSFPVLDTTDYAGDYDPDTAKYLLESALDPPFPVSIIRILAMEYSVRFMGISWINELEQMYRYRGYKIRTNRIEKITTEGYKLDPNACVKMMGKGGENWVGYFVDATQPFLDAIYHQKDNIYRLQTQHWSAVRIKDEWLYPKFAGEIPTLSYGDMAVIYCENACEFNWQIPEDHHEPVERKKTEHFKFKQQQNYTSLFIEIDRENDPTEIGAFLGKQCIGASVVQDSLAHICAYIPGGSEENLKFRMHYDNDDEKVFGEYLVSDYTMPTIVDTVLKANSQKDVHFISLREGEDVFSFLPEEIFTTDNSFQYGLAEDCRVELYITDGSGRKLKTLVRGKQTRGKYKVNWDRTDMNGKKVSQGKYFYRLTLNDETLKRKMLLVK